MASVDHMIVKAAFFILVLWIGSMEVRLRKKANDRYLDDLKKFLDEKFDFLDSKLQGLDKRLMRIEDRMMEGK